MNFHPSLERTSKQYNFSFPSTLHIKALFWNTDSNHKRNCSNVSAIKTVLGTSACLGADKWEYLGLAGCKTDQVQAPASHVNPAETSKAHKHEISYISLGCLVVTQLSSFHAQKTKSKHRDVSALDILKGKLKSNTNLQKHVATNGNKKSSLFFWSPFAFHLAYSYQLHLCKLQETQTILWQHFKDH